jgi:ApaG protein
LEEDEGSEWQFKYHVEFKNSGVDTVQMLSRHWVFGDASGKTSEVKGPGAVGETPVLKPGESWSYDSVLISSSFLQSLPAVSLTGDIWRSIDEIE